MGRCGRNRENRPRHNEMAETTDRIERKGPIRGLVDTFHHSLDEKNRLTIPSEWRDALGCPEYIYVMPSASEECLELVPVELMERVLQSYQSDDLFDDEADADGRAIAAISQMLKIDSAGRIRISDKLLEHAHIKPGAKSGVTMIGGIRKATLWSEALKPAPKDGKLDLREYRAVVEKRKLLAKSRRGKC